VQCYAPISDSLTSRPFNRWTLGTISNQTRAGTSAGEKKPTRTSLRRDGIDAPPSGGGGGTPEAASGEGDYGRGGGRRPCGAAGGDGGGSPRGAPHARERHMRGQLCLVAASLLRRSRGGGGVRAEEEQAGFYRGYRRGRTGQRLRALEIAEGLGRNGEWK
jgi:hypothetical protein